jgi:hypothetical protein
MTVKINKIISLISAITGLLLLLGCENSQTESAVGLDISGEWTGNYARPDATTGDNEETPLTAHIEQNGDSIVMEVVKSSDTRILVGKIDEEGNMQLMDVSNRQTWTSMHPATPNNIDLHDYLMQLWLTIPDAEQAIHLNR